MENFKFFSSCDINLLRAKFVKLLSAKTEDRVLLKDHLICEDAMFAEYLQEGLLLQESIGISSNLRVSKPREFIDFIYRQTLQNFEKSQAFSKSALRWRIYVFLQKLDEVGIAGLKADKNFGENAKYFINLANSKKNRMALSDEIAKLYDDYQLYRSDWLQNWQDNKLVLSASNQANFFEQSKAQAQTNQTQLKDEDKWQALLWQYLYKQIKSSNLDNSNYKKSRLELHQDFLNTFCDKADWLLEEGILPKYIFVAGTNSIAPQFLQVLLELSKKIQIYFLYFNPSNYYWIDGKTEKHILKQSQFVEQILQEEYGNPLLLSLCQQGVDFLNLLEKNGIDISENQLENPTNQKQPSLLKKIQQDIIEFRTNAQALEEEDPQVLQSIKKAVALKQDNSIQFNVCHTPMREVEILQDQILDFFANQTPKASANSLSAIDFCEKTDENPLSAIDFLQPKDILVLVSDIKTYAPIIRRVFGASLPNSDKPILPFYINDLYEKDQQKLAKSLLNLLNAFVSSRFESAQLLDFLNFAPLAQKFKLNPEDLENLKKYVKQANIRWGLNTQTKQNLGLSTDDVQNQQNTWAYGVKRMLWGFITTQKYPNINPLNTDYGKDSVVIGSLAEFVEKLIYYQKEFSNGKKQTYKNWVELLNNFLQDFYEITDKENYFGKVFVQNKLQEWQESCEAGGLEENLLSFEDFLFTYANLLQEARVRKNYFGNHIQFCEFVAGRSIGYKKIFVLGLEEDKFPSLKSNYSSLFELFYKNPRLGDRSRHFDDKFSFLQTILLAEENLILSWSGKSSENDKEIPSSVLVANLQNQLENILGKNSNGESLLQNLICEFPLQGFDQAYFEIETQGETKIENEKQTQGEIQSESEKAPKTAQAPLTFSDSQTNSAKPIFTTYRKDYFSIYQEQKKYTDEKLLQHNQLTNLDKLEMPRHIKAQNLIRFLKSPTTSFFTDYLQVSKFDYKKISLQDIETFQLEGLEAWSFKNNIEKKFEQFYDELYPAKAKTDADDANAIKTATANSTQAPEDIKQKLEKDLQDFFADGYVFETPIAEQQIQTSILENLQGVFNNYAEFRQNPDYELLMRKTNHKLKLKLNSKIYYLDIDLPDIYLQKSNGALVAFYIALEEDKKLKENHKKIKYIFNNIIFSLALENLIDFKNLFFNNPDYKKQNSYTLVLNNEKGLKIPALLGSPTEESSLSAIDFLQNIVALYPQPLATCEKTAFAYLSTIYKKDKNLKILENLDELENSNSNSQLRKNALKKAQAIYEGGFISKGEIEYTDFIDTRYKDFAALKAFGFEQATKAVYKDLFLLMQKTK